MFITTPTISTTTAKVNVALKVSNATKQDENITVATTLIAPDNAQSDTEEEEITIPHNRNKDISFDINVSNPLLWDMDSPRLYLAKIQIFKGNEQIDEYTTKFGIRSIEFSAEKGFLLNGKNVLLKGGCLHHDNGLLGAASFKRAEYRKVELMKKNGFNSIRTSHNPVSKYFLDACDELGVLVIEEAFDQWEEAKTANDYHRFFDKNWEKDITAMVTRDRNHPSIIMWSMGNEIPERGRASGVKIAKMIGDKIRSLDATRPNTQAIFTFWEDSNKGLTWEKDTPAAFAVTDIAGYNYNSFNYESDHKKYPNRIMYSSESYPYNAYVNWRLTEKLPYVIGDFVWTGMDYIGEAGIGISKYVTEEVSLQHPQPWPWFNGYCGDIDLIGNKKPQGYFRDVVWDESKAEILVHEPIPAGKWEQVHRWGWPKEEASWTWPGEEGKTLNVNVYTKYSNVALFLNDKLIGKQSIDLDKGITASFKVNYKAGELKAVCSDLKGGKTVKVLKTAGQVESLKLVAENTIIENSTDEIAYVRVSALDKDGNIVPNCSMPLKIDISGPANIIGAGSSYPKIKGSLQDNKFFLYRGQGLVIIRSNGEKGDINLTIFDIDNQIVKSIHIKAQKR